MSLAAKTSTYYYFISSYIFFIDMPEEKIISDHDGYEEMNLLQKTSKQKSFEILVDSIQTRPTWLNQSINHNSRNYLVSIRDS